MGKRSHSTNDLTILGITVHKEKSRSDGERICLCGLAQNPQMWILCHLNANGEIADSRSYQWGFTSEKTVKTQAIHDYNLWKQILMYHIDNYSDFQSVKEILPLVN